MSADVVIWNGSPRPDGDAMALATRLARSLDSGAVSVVNCYDAAVRPCDGCRRCRAAGACRLDDDGFPALMREARTARYVVMASPLHFSSLSAPLVAFISRFQVYWGRDMTGVFPGVAGLAVVGGSHYPDMFAAARKVAGAAFKTLAMPLAGMVTASRTDETPAADNGAALAEADLLAARMREALVKRAVRSPAPAAPFPSPPPVG